MGGGTGAGVFADGPQPASNMKSMVEANIVRMQFMAAYECKGLPRSEAATACHDWIAISIFSKGEVS